jgi:hypothetical protein
MFSGSAGDSTSNYVQQIRSPEGLGGKVLLTEQMGGDEESD